MAVKVAIAGVGNCANSLIQGVTFYADTAEGDVIPGLMHNRFGPYAAGDIDFVAAFDVDSLKVGSDLADAMWASQNGTYRFAEVAATGVIVQRGPTLDGLGSYYREMITESDAPPVDVAQALRDSGADVLVCYLPVGSEVAAKHYAQAALDAGVAFVNALPVFIASAPEWAAKFADAGIPILGTSPEAIDLAEHRGAFSRVLDAGGLISPKNGTAVSFEDAKRIADDIGPSLCLR